VKDYVGHRFEKAIDRAIRLKLISDEVLFKPDEKLTKAEAAALIVSLRDSIIRDVTNALVAKGIK